MPFQKKVKKRTPEQRASALKTLLEKTQNVATKRRFVECVIDEVGSIEQLAQIIAKFIKDPNCPASLKAKLFDLVVRTLGEAEDPNPVGPEDLTDTADVELLLDRKLLRLSQIEELDPANAST